MLHSAYYPLLLLWSTAEVLLLLNDNLQLAYFSSVLIPVRLPPAVDGHQSLAVQDLTIACDDAILLPQAVHVPTELLQPRPQPIQCPFSGGLPPVCTAGLQLLHGSGS